MKYLVAVFSLLLLCCGEQPRVALDMGADSGVPDMACPTTAVYDSLAHCGSCGNSCNLNTADQCNAGVCACGNGPACSDPEVCHHGDCLTPDPVGKPCEFDYQCDVTYQCVGSRCTFVGCQPEVCNGYDDDCDGLVDNVGSAPMAEYCYSGPGGPGGDIMLPCKRGVRTCVDGAWTECAGEIPPVAEAGFLACDLQDNNCDGCVDGNLVDGVCVQEPVPYIDVLFLIDRSGSMSGNIEAVKQASQLFSNRLSVNEDIRWGIVSVPGNTDGESELMLPLSSFSVFEPMLQGIDTGPGGTEPTWDAVYESATEELPVGWRFDSIRVIIVFTDEEAQSTRGFSESDMCASLTHGEVLVVAVDEQDFGDWDECAANIVPLPNNLVGSGTACTTNSDCLVDELCREGLCVTETVIELAEGLDFVIDDPCGG